MSTKVISRTVLCKKEMKNNTFEDICVLLCQPAMMRIVTLSTYIVLNKIVSKTRSLMNCVFRENLEQRGSRHWQVSNGYNFPILQTFLNSTTSSAGYFFSLITFMVVSFCRGQSQNAPTEQRRLPLPRISKVPPPPTTQRLRTETKMVKRRKTDVSAARRKLG